MANPLLASPFLTDFYQLTMTYGYWKCQKSQMPAVFTLYFRSNPFGGGYSVLAGLEPALQFLEQLHFSESDCRFIANLRGPSGQTLFDAAFVRFLAESRFECDVEAIPEGSVVFPNEPILKVKGPIWQCQWVETALLNQINFQTLIATKAARIVQAARGGEVIDFGLRRAQGADGGLSATRAAYIGGISGTSNLLAAETYGIPARGTSGHSWIMSFDSERESFEKYADALPDLCTLLVDTYDTVQGIENAISVGLQLKKQGRSLSAIRLDSGDLAYLSHEARIRLDTAGLNHVKILASNELDEYLIQSLFLQEAKIDLWGVGTKLITGQGQGAMSGVYKLSAVKEKEVWKPKIKVSDQPVKTSIPGLQRVARFYNSSGKMEGDLIYAENETLSAIDRLVDPMVAHRVKVIQKEWKPEPLLVPTLQGGKRIGAAPSLLEIRARVTSELARLHAGHKRFENPHTYPVGLSPALSSLKAKLVEERTKKA